MPFMNFLVHSLMKQQLTESLLYPLALNPETEPEGMRGRSLGTVGGACRLRKKALWGMKLKMKVEADAIVTPHDPPLFYRFTAGTVWVAY